MANLTSIQWAIVGGESGPRARKIKPDWVREILGISVAAMERLSFLNNGAARTRSAPDAASMVARGMSTRLRLPENVRCDLLRSLDCGLARI